MCVLTLINCRDLNLTVLPEGEIPAGATRIDLRGNSRLSVEEDFPSGVVVVTGE